MNTFSLKYFGVFFILISFFSFFNIIYCYYFDILDNLNHFIITFSLNIFLGSILIIFKNIKIEKINLYNRILTVFFGYFILPLSISIPYYLSIENIEFINCYFESISGFTSTGFSTFKNYESLDQTLILWRSSSQLTYLMKI